MATEELREGTVVGRCYRIEQVLGRGGLGQVYMCSETSAGGARVALKVLSSKNPTEKGAQTLRDEFSLLSRIKHPCLVRILDFGLLEGSRLPFVVEEYIDGKDIFAATEKCDRAHAISLMVELCRVVQYLHTRGILHRDLKPSNVLVREDGGKRSIKVLDFGFAGLASGNGRDRGLGTLGYAAPEVLMGKGGGHPIGSVLDGCHVLSVADAPASI